MNCTPPQLILMASDVTRCSTILQLIYLVVDLTSVLPAPFPRRVALRIACTAIPCDNDLSPVLLQGPFRQCRPCRGGLIYLNRIRNGDIIGLSDLADSPVVGTRVWRHMKHTLETEVHL